MTQKAEVPDHLAKAILMEQRDLDAAQSRLRDLIAEAVDASSLGAVARLLGISRQAVKARLAVARAARA